MALSLVVLWVIQDDRDLQRCRHTHLFLDQCVELVD